MKKILTTILVFTCCSAASAQVTLPRLIRDSMILQRDTKLNIWGWASPGEKVSVKFNNKKYNTTTAANGKWLLNMDAVKAGGPYTMQVDGKNHITINNILVGDVWLCSGQSNMVHQMFLHHERYENEIANANYPDIRQFWIPTLTDLQQPKDDLPTGYWKSANPEDVLQFSAVAYFFAKQIYEKYHIPIGLINASVGGTPAEAWISEEGLKKFDNIYSIIQKNKDTVYINQSNRNANAYDVSRPVIIDRGMTEKWFDVDYAPKEWRNIHIPGYWEDQGIRNFDGIVWYRKEIDVPSSMVDVPAKLSMGRIVDADEVYINGKFIGRTTYQYPQRRYAVPAGVLKGGKNTIVIRVTNTAGKGGFVPDKPYYLSAGNQQIDLKGDWQYKVGATFTPPKSFVERINMLNQPTALFNAMIAPLINFSVKGFLWYQGEANSNRNAELYYQVLPALIKDWRTQWHNDELPFIYAQLPNFMDAQYLPSESSWAAIRDAQLKTLSVPNTAMAVTIDLGEWNDIHPDNKKDVGDRLALGARNLVYGEKDLVASGPLYDTAFLNGNKIVVRFKSTGSGLQSINKEALGEFAIAGTDKKFTWANATIEGNTVVVWNENITDPKFVRYAWADNPVNANLYNNEGLPASPFQAEVKTPENAGLPWNNKQCAVVLTYDDALNVHLTNAIPLLDSLGLKGTFYICNNAGQLQQQMQGWKRAAANGHELGNHTLFHACEGQRKGREWVQPDYDLLNYTVKRVVSETRSMNVLLQAMDGRSKRTFAFPCADLFIKDTPYIKYLDKDFIAARSVRSEMVTVADAKLYDLPCYMINGETGDQLIALVKKAVAEKKLLVFLFHGVGGEHGLNVSLEAHGQLLKYLKENEKDIWIAPMVDVAEFIKEKQAK